MNGLKKILIISLFFSFTNQLLSQNMSNEKLGGIFYTLSDTIIGEEGQWQFKIGDITFLCITDISNNRMRIISPVIDIEELTENELLKCLKANFHSALDVRYSISDEILWVAFIHPFKELSKNQAIDAVKQVYSAVSTYGTSYSSTFLTFPSSEPDLNKG